jgi:hypothetical protein
MRELMMSLLAYLFRPVVERILGRDSTPILHLNGNYTDADLAAFKAYWAAQVTGLGLEK